MPELSVVDGPPILRLFGGAVIQSGRAPLGGRPAHRHRLALLAILAVSGRPVTRDKLVAYLWPERDTEPARNLLKTSVHELRKALGEGVIVSTGDTLSLDPSLLRCDVTEFEAAIRDGDLRTARALYVGPFLDGFFLKESSEFEDWSSAERRRLARLYERLIEVVGDADEIPVLKPPAVLPETPRQGVASAKSGAFNRWTASIAALIVVAVGMGMAFWSRPAAPALPDPVTYSQPNDSIAGTALQFSKHSAAATRTGTLITPQVDDIALDMWVRYDGAAGDTIPQGLFYNGNGGLTGWGLMVIGPPDGHPDGTIAVMAGGIVISATSLVLQKNVWQHLSAERREGKVTVTLDDSSYSLGNFPVTAAGGKYKDHEQTSLGSAGALDSTSDGFHGAIDRFRMRNLAAGWWFDRWFFDEASGDFTTGYKNNRFEIRNARWVPSVALPAREVFWSRLESLCGQAFNGRATIGDKGDTSFANALIVIHGFRCTPNEIHFALHVGEDHSRVLVLHRDANRLRVRNELRRDNGTVATGSGGIGATHDEGRPGLQTFVGTAGESWVIEVAQYDALSFVFRRSGTNRLRIDFPLARQVPNPPPPWGHGQSK